MTAEQKKAFEAERKQNDGMVVIEVDSEDKSSFNLQELHAKLQQVCDKTNQFDMAVKSISQQING